MYTSDNTKARKDKTIKAHHILLKADQQDFQGSITFNFSKGKGIVHWEVRMTEQFTESVESNKIIVF